VTSLKSLQQTRLGRSAEKGDPPAGDTDCWPSLALRDPWPPDPPSPSLPAQGGEGARERCSTIVSVN
jgi:hypothetical protein